MQNSPARSPIDVGSVIADTYTIEALIGRGGMGAVFRASHKRLPGKHVAIKMLHAELSGDEVLARFKREAEIASRLGHPNICAVHDFNVLPDGTPYLVLDYLEGESLAQRLKAGPLKLEQAMSIVRQVGSALAAAHREGIVHRDLKPQNIFLVPTEIDGRDIEVAKVLDFGISKIRGSDTVKTQESSLLGTPQYMAPEQATGQHSAVDERTDVFALGAIVYEMLAGHPAFTGASIPEVVFKVVYEQPIPLAQEVPSLPAAIAAAVNQAMSKSAGDRFSTVSNFVEALTGQALTGGIRPGTGSGHGPVPISSPISGTDETSVPPSVPPAKRTGNDAFAQTVGSGDHGESPIKTAAAPVAAGAPTLASISSSSKPPAESAASSTDLPPARRSPAFGRRHRRRGRSDRGRGDVFRDASAAGSATIFRPHRRAARATTDACGDAAAAEAHAAAEGRRPDEAGAGAGRCRRREADRSRARETRRHEARPGGQEAAGGRRKT